MAGCCCSETDPHLQAMRQRQARMLWAVLSINTLMFAAEFGAGWWAGSTALLGDSLDMLGDALVYGLSLFVVARSVQWKAISAAAKGALMLGLGLLVLGEALAKTLSGHVPDSGFMMGVGAVALAANIVCLFLLTRHRDDDVNMRSSWICSRNDLFANGGVIVAGLLVALTDTVWPDVIVGAAIAVLFLQSSIGVLRDARRRYIQAQANEETAEVRVRS
ncbi:MAG: cation diffusion facilitator family transporter [Salinisphaera sp.]|uniref:cation diffusion facilitator family transporter n=1 Tax=Salinisphaera sp. TaxID=1914330 RepID=UPI003C7A2EDC